MGTLDADVLLGLSGDPHSWADGAPVIDLWTRVERGPDAWTGRHPWVVRASEFIFPTADNPESPDVGPDDVVMVDTPAGPRMARGLTEAERARRRSYVDVRAVPVICYDLYQKLVFARAVRVLFEIIGGALTTPRLPDWRENRVSTFVTDLGHFSDYRPATRHEASLFSDVVSEHFVAGVPS